MIDLSAHTQDCGDYAKFIQMCKSEPFIVLDTETTGLQRGSEIIDIAIISSAGKVLLNTLLRPTKRIPADASGIHGITNEHCADAPTWGEVKETVMLWLNSENLVVYNSLYDRKMMHFTDQNHALPETDYKASTAWWDCMTAFAEWYGDKHDYYGTYRWKKLSTAVEIVDAKPERAHRALGDCLMTLSLINRLIEIDAPDFHRWLVDNNRIPF